MTTVLTSEDLQTWLLSKPVLHTVLAWLKKEAPADAAHDSSHVLRVLNSAWDIAQTEGGDLEIIVAATLLHDAKNLPKGHPKAKSSSSLSAEFAVALLRDAGFPEDKLPVVYDAIVCHSFSKGLVPSSLEGKVLQDADRLDALGAIGIARLFACTGERGGQLYCPGDPLGRTDREIDDKAYGVDHFRKKLFLLPGLMQTETGRRLAEERVAIMHQYLDVLEREINPPLEQKLLG